MLKNFNLAPLPEFSPLLFQMDPSHRLYTSIICSMLASTNEAVYTQDLEEDNGQCVCLIIFRPHYRIEIIEDLLLIINEMEIPYASRFLPNTTQFHFDELDHFSLELIVETLTSVEHDEVGNWAFLGSST